MARFDSAIALADRLITKNGETVTIRRRVDGAPPDPAKPWEPGAPTESNQTTAMVFLDAEVARQLGILLKEGQQLGLAPAVGTFIPDASTDIVIRASGEKWTIKKVETLNPNGQLIMHALALES